jgi:hypothetical protein
MIIPAYIFSGNSVLTSKFSQGGVILDRFFGFEKNFQAVSKDIGNFCDVLS